MSSQSQSHHSSFGFLSPICSILSMLLLFSFMAWYSWGVDDVYAAPTGVDCYNSLNIAVSPIECSSLVTLYNNTFGPNWTINTNRNTDTSICTWYGVSCATIGGKERVIGLSLPNNNITGSSIYTLEALSSLTFLQYIDLSYNHISLPLPETWGDLVFLTGINLSHNEVFGRLPESWSNLTNLMALDLSFNKIYGSFPGVLIDNLPNYGSGYIDVSNNCIIMSTLNASQLGWFNANVVVEPYKICVVYDTLVSEGSLSGMAIQVLQSGDDANPILFNPQAGYIFVRRSDGRTDNPRTDTGVTSSLYVLANTSRFYNLYYYAGDPLYFALSGSYQQVVGSGGNGAMIEAVALQSGYSFVRRSDGRTDNPRTDTGVAQNITVNAIRRTSCDLMLNRDVSVEECQALVDLYTQTDGDAWIQNDGWYTDSPVCDRYGVACTNISGQDRVTSVVLVDNNLSGTLPLSLSGLTEIGLFDLRNNSIVGVMPDTITTSRQNLGSPYILFSGNCLQSENYDNITQSFIDINTDLTTTPVCADMSITQSTASSGSLSIGSVMRYIVSYMNKGPNLATDVVIKSYPSSGLQINTASLPYTPVLSPMTYMVAGDTCFTSLMSSTTGPYADDLNAYAVLRGVSDMKSLLENFLGYTGDSNRGTWFFHYWNDNNPSNPFDLWYASDILDEVYGYPHGGMSVVHPGCGKLGSFDHYLFSIGSLMPGMGGSFTIDALITGTVLGQTGVTHTVLIESATGYEVMNSDNTNALIEYFANGSPGTGSPGTGSVPGVLSRGGGGGGGLSRDSCPTGDDSASYYDGLCGSDKRGEQLSGVANTTTTVVDTPTLTREDCHAIRSVSLEMQCLARQIGGSALQRLVRHDASSAFTRDMMAKVLVEFAMNIMHRLPDTTKVCTFNDTRSRVSRQACQLNMMGIGSDYTALEVFKPREAMTKQQFITTIGRMMYRDNQTAKIYAQRLFADGIIYSRSVRGPLTKYFVMHTLAALAMKTGQ